MKQEKIPYISGIISFEDMNKHTKQQVEKELELEKNLCKDLKKLKKDYKSSRFICNQLDFFIKRCKNEVKQLNEDLGRNGSNRTRAFK